MGNLKFNTIIGRIESDLLSSLFQYLVPFIDKKINSKALKQKSAPKTCNLEKIVENSKPKIGINDVKELEKLLSKINSLGKEVLMMHGNHESDKILNHLCGKFENITFFHRKIINKGGILFLGFGGGGFSQTDKEFEEFVKKNESKLIGKRIVLVTHAPPYKTALDLLGKTHEGNKSIKKFIEKFKPIYAISGHFHENSGVEEKIKGTVY